MKILLKQLWEAAIGLFRGENLAWASLKIYPGKHRAKYVSYSKVFRNANQTIKGPPAKVILTAVNYGLETGIIKKRDLNKLVNASDLDRLI